MTASALSSAWSALWGASRVGHAQECAAPGRSSRPWTPQATPPAPDWSRLYGYADHRLGPKPKQPQKGLRCFRLPWLRDAVRGLLPPGPSWCSFWKLPSGPSKHSLRGVGGRLWFWTLQTARTQTALSISVRIGLKGATGGQACIEAPASSSAQPDQGARAAVAAAPCLVPNSWPAPWVWPVPEPPPSCAFPDCSLPSWPLTLPVRRSLGILPAQLGRPLLQEALPCPSQWLRPHCRTAYG